MVEAAKREITLGNWLSVGTTLITVLGAVWAGAAMLGDLKTRTSMIEIEIAGLKSTDVRFATEIAVRRGREDADHDLIVEMRADLKQMRATLERLERSDRERRGDVNRQ